MDFQNAVCLKKKIENAIEYSAAKASENERIWPIFRALIKLRRKYDSYLTSALH